jgi:hypothetical protein
MKNKIFLSILCCLVSLPVCAQFANTAFWKQGKPFLKITSGAQIISALNCSNVTTVQALASTAAAVGLASPLTVNRDRDNFLFRFQLRHSNHVGHHCGRCDDGQFLFLSE